MPRSGSRTFYSITESIVSENESLKLCNGSGHGRQHQQWVGSMHNGVSLSIVRDLRDVVVSAYPYILNHHKKEDSDPRQASGKHPLYDDICKLDKRNAYSVLIDKLLPDCYSYFKSYVNTNSYMFLFRHFFEDLECSINNLSDILRTDVDTHKIYENHKIDKLKESNPKHRNGVEML